jgi:uncharacterized Zn finger protein
MKKGVKPMAKTNDDVLFYVYCPNCQKITNAASWILLEKAGSVTIECSDCGAWIKLAYDGETVFVNHG